MHKREEERGDRRETALVYHRIRRKDGIEGRSRNLEIDEHTVMEKIILVTLFGPELSWEIALLQPGCAVPLR